MPYIKQTERLRIENDDAKGFGLRPDNAGELNYLFTELAVSYLTRHGLNYQHLNDVIGALEGAKMELYRRVAAPYEDTKIAANGDVYPASLLPKEIEPIKFIDPELEVIGYDVDVTYKGDRK